MKGKGKGNKPNASVAISEDDIHVLFEKKLLGIERPEALLNTLWLNNTTQFGLRGCKEHRDVLGRREAQENINWSGIS